MKSILGLVSLLLTAGCANLPFLSSGIAPKSVYKIEQATLTSPNGPNWYLLQNELHMLNLRKNYDDKTETAVLTAAMFPVKGTKNSKAFLQYVVEGRAKNDDKTRFKVLSVRNEFVTFKGLPCVKYQTVSEDHRDKGVASADFDYFKTNGYVCRYPLEYIGFQFEVSHRSKTKEIPADLMKVAQEYFQNIELVDATVQRLKTIP